MHLTKVLHRRVDVLYERGGEHEQTVDIGHRFSSSKRTRHPTRGFRRVNKRRCIWTHDHNFRIATLSKQLSRQRNLLKYLQCHGLERRWRLWEVFRPIHRTSQPYRQPNQHFELGSGRYRRRRKCALSIGQKYHHSTRRLCFCLHQRFANRT